MQPKFSIKTLLKAKPKSLLRLAKWIGIPVVDNCECEGCMMLLTIEINKRIGQDAGWPPRNLERKW